MRRAASTLPVTPAMLRHFAVLTATATGCLAMFASGENSGAVQAVTQKRAVAAASEASVQLAQSANGKREIREIGGLRLAAGTKLGYESQPDYDVERNPEASEGNIRYASPASASAAELAAPAPGPAPVEMVRDASGVPAPAAAAALKRSPAGKQLPPRRATQQDYERTMAASRFRSGSAGVNVHE